jgi:hypothetical protein
MSTECFASAKSGKVNGAPLRGFSVTPSLLITGKRLRASWRASACRSPDAYDTTVGREPNVCHRSNPRTYEMHPFETLGDMKIFIADENRNRFSPWTEPLEEWQALLLLAASMSFLGSVVRYTVDSLDRRKKAIAGYCLLGFAIGPCLMAVAWVSELLILEGTLRFRPETVASFCFLGGIFVQDSWNYVSTRARNILRE